MKTQVAIIGGGPSGLLLSQLLHIRGIDSVVLECKTKDYVLGRIRAGVLEQGLVRMLEEADCAERLHAEGHVHDGTLISYSDEMFRVDFTEHTGTPVIVYGQTEVTRDLYAAREAAGGRIEYEVEDVVINRADSEAPFVTYSVGGEPRRVDCDFVAGCDGFHGVSRQTIPLDVRREDEKVYPFGWLGILSKTPPVNHELIYSNSPRGFALCSMRNEKLSRYYRQCSLSDKPEDWTDEAFWQELKRRIPAEQAGKLVTGQLKAGDDYRTIAARHGVSARYLGDLIHFAFLSPKLVRAILEGRQPPALTANWLRRHGLPDDWAEQERIVAQL